MKNPHALDAASVLAAMGGDAQRGLDSAEAQMRLARHGANRLPEAKVRGAWLRLALQFHNPLIYVLLAAAALTLLLRDFTDTGVIAGVVIVNAFIGFLQEGKAEQALAAVHQLLAHRAVVLRDGLRQEIDAATLVPGDVVLIEERQPRAGGFAPVRGAQPARGRGRDHRRIGGGGQVHRARRR